MSSAAPRVTVLMPVYNSASFLPDAIESILRQSFDDFEFLIVEDGSTDASFRIIQSYRDPRIRLLRNGANLGLIPTLNRGLDQARGEYVARMDADDISLEKRLGRQVAFLDSNPEVTVCGSSVVAFDGATRSLWSPPLSHGEIRANLLFESVLYHPAVMMRRAVLARHGLRYDPEYPHAEDYELWARMSRNWRLANIGEPLLEYRLHNGSVSRSKSQEQAQSTRKVRRALLADLGIEAAAADLELHDAISLRQVGEEPGSLERAQRWMLELLRANEKNALVPQQLFATVLARRWYEICFLAASFDKEACRYFYDSRLSRFRPLTLREKVLFRLRALRGR